jgi:hypothetical protein
MKTNITIELNPVNCGVYDFRHIETGLADVGLSIHVRTRVAQPFKSLSYGNDYNTKAQALYDASRPEIRHSPPPSSRHVLSRTLTQSNSHVQSGAYALNTRSGKLGRYAGSTTPCRPKAKQGAGKKPHNVLSNKKSDNERRATKTERQRQRSAKQKAAAQFNPNHARTKYVTRRRQAFNTACRRPSLSIPKENPAEAGSLFLPSLTTIPVIDVLLGPIFLVTIALLDFAFQLIALAIDNVQIIVSELAPLFFDFALGLLPVTFDAVPVHDVSSLGLRPCRKFTESFESNAKEAGRLLAPTYSNLIRQCQHIRSHQQPVDYFLSLS